MGNAYYSVNFGIPTRPFDGPGTSGISRIGKCAAFNGLAAVAAYQCAKRPVILRAKYTPSYDSALVSILKIRTRSVADGAAQGVQLGIEEAS